MPITFSEQFNISKEVLEIIGVFDVILGIDKGRRPMNIIWRLDRPIPAKFLKKTNKLVVG